MPESSTKDRTKDRTRSYVLAGQPIEPPRLNAGLHLVATPIGNLRDITLRALETLAAASVIACEDTRVTRKLLDHYGISTPLTPYHEHNAAAARPKLLARLAAGETIALVSDAGTPLISDPGFKLVRAAADANQPQADEVDAMLRRALQHGSVKDAVSDVVAATGRPRREIYQRALALSGEGGDGSTP